MDLMAQVEQEIVRLKSIQSTIAFYQASGRKQLTQYLGTTDKKNKENQLDINASINDLEPIKKNLLEELEQAQKIVGKPWNLYQQNIVKQQRDNNSKSKGLFKTTQKLSGNTDQKKRKRQTDKLNKQMQILRRLNDLSYHLRRHQLHL